MSYSAFAQNTYTYMHGHVIWQGEGWRYRMFATNTGMINMYDTPHRSNTATASTHAISTQSVLWSSRRFTVRRGRDPPCSVSDQHNPACPLLKGAHRGLRHRIGPGRRILPLPRPRRHGGTAHRSMSEQPFFDVGNRLNVHISFLCHTATLVSVVGF